MLLNVQSNPINMMIQQRFASQLIKWQKEQGRHNLPWQGTQEVYKVWLSEVMLQQTQVVTVIEYYPRFLKRFPTLQDLALVHADEVLSLWSGLGYYSRARNLHRCAQQVIAEHGGVFPQTAQALMKLPGIGRTTAAAIAAFCFNERISIFDGNVKRVLARVLTYGEDISKTAADKELWGYAQTLLPSQELIEQQQGLGALPMVHYTQGLMDLGATLCQARKVECKRCPMQNMCQAHAQGRELEYPHKTRKVKRSTQAGYLLWLTSPLGVWLIQRPSKGIWGGLYSFPLFEEEGECKAALTHLSPQWVQSLLPFKHVLTHIDWVLQATHAELSLTEAQNLPTEIKGHEGATGQWYTLKEALAMGLPAPIRAMLKEAV